MNTKMKSNLANISSATVMGLLLSLFGYWILAAIPKLSFLTSAFTEQSLTLFALLLVWVLIAVLLFLVRRAEDRSLNSIGLRSISIKEVLLAVGIGLVLALSVPLLTLLANQLIPSAKEGSITEVATSNTWLLLLLSFLTIGVAEEIIYRGYIIERISELTGKRWLAINVSVFAFVMAHIFNWNWMHILAVVLPLGLVMSWLYVWKRNLLFNMIVHIVVDLPMVFISLLS